MNISTKINFSGITFKNPVVLASGTCGFGQELNEVFDISKLGGISLKGLTLNKRDGNEGERIFETASGIMNSVGLENPGVQSFIKKELNDIKNFDLVKIVNVSGHSIDDYLKAVELLNEETLDIIELNISCPNVKQGGMNFGVKTEAAREIVRLVRDICKHKLIVKLSPNAEDITAIAKATEEEGADGISLVNTFQAMAIDIKKRKPVFNNIYAGLSGPAIKPIALRMVHQVCKAVKIPVMGLGGITTYKDAIEFIMAGASIVQIGTATFTKPDISLDIVKEIESFMQREKIESLDEIRGII